MTLWSARQRAYAHVYACARTHAFTDVRASVRGCAFKNCVCASVIVCKRMYVRCEFSMGVALACVQAYKTSPYRE